MIVLHATECPVLECIDASLAVQSEKESTLIESVLVRFRATGVLPNAHSLADALQPEQYPESFVDGANVFTEKKGVYDDEGISFSDGLQRDLALASQSVSSGGEETGESGAGEAGKADPGAVEAGKGE